MTAGSRIEGGREVHTHVDSGTEAIDRFPEGHGLVVNEGDAASANVVVEFVGEFEAKSRSFGEFLNDFGERPVAEVESDESGGTESPAFDSRDDFGGAETNFGIARVFGGAEGGDRLDAEFFEGGRGLLSVEEPGRAEPGDQRVRRLRFPFGAGRGQETTGEGGPNRGGYEHWRALRSRSPIVSSSQSLEEVKSNQGIRRSRNSKGTSVFSRIKP